MSPATAQRPARVQVATVRVRDTFVRDQFGESGQRTFRDAASAELASVLASNDKPPGGWVPFGLFVEANVLADALFGKGDLALVREMGRFAASRNLGVWKGMFMRHATPAMFMSIVAGIWSHHYDGGRLVSRPAAAATLLVSVLDFPEPHRSHCLSIAGWVQGSLELGPRKEIAVEETACRCKGDALCEMRVSWK